MSTDEANKIKRDVQNAKARIALLCDTIRETKQELFLMEEEVESLSKFVKENNYDEK